jgi:putative hydrolase of the HAD superfamily
MQSKPPQWLFLDLDNTLWDFETNAEEALSVLFHRHHLHLRSGFDVHGFVKLYKEINDVFWKRYEKGEIGKDFLRTQRFTQTFREMGIPESEHPENVWEEYLAICPGMKAMIPGAMEFLSRAAANLPIALITNGFQATQKGKSESSGIVQYIQFIMDSETAGSAKPNPEIFAAACRKASVNPENSLYVGDTWDTDVAGSIAAGIPVIWFNRNKTPEPDTFAGNSLYLGSCTRLHELSDRLASDYNWV